ncbi:MAG TPA: nicotinate-nucleotide adenylyltransferase [Alphaproteobacteria bacterium]|nr:nicotinate-nucleotide adenylyltransferase [Alphaproteobacteria bacterium]
MIARPLAARAFGPPPPPCVGLLGGSFNPAHDGHRHIAELALKRLALDEVWWMVSPQNPLKPDRDMASLAARQASARRHASHPRMRVTAIENALKTRYTADTLTALRRRFPRIRFVWLMGADNLAQMERWERWSLIFHTMPIAVFARLPYSTKALASKAARRFSRLRRPPRHAARLARDDLPAWVFLHTRLHPASASAIRRARSPGRVRRTT